jgi:hypothetical protein
MTNSDDEMLDRHFAVTAQGPVCWEGAERGHAQWFFHRDDLLPDELQTLWAEAWIWQDDLRWDPASDLGQKFFRLCRAELLTVSEARRIVAFLKAHLPQWGPAAIRRINEGEIRGELPARMMVSPRGLVVRIDLSEFGEGLGFPVGGFAEPAHPALGRPIGWCGWPCRQNDLEAGGRGGLRWRASKGPSRCPGPRPAPDK